MLCNLNDVLIPARKEKYAVGLFNSVSLEMTRAVFQAAEELNVPFIIGTAEILLKSASLQEVADMVIARAERSKVPVVLHYDHGLTYDRCIEAMDLGFTSVMYDCSTAPYEENMSRLAEMVKIAHSRGVTVEGELGHVGDNDGEGRLKKPSDYFTDPDKAAEFVEKTGVDALAIAVGNAHGDYKFPPKLDFDRIRDIGSRTHVPLVLHGGSGLSDSDFRTAIDCGISKINIFTDIDRAMAMAAKSSLDEGILSACEMIPYEVEAIKKVTMEKMRLFSAGGHGY